MNDLSKKLSEAEATMAVANTPLFLLSRLKHDPEVIRLSQSFSSDDLLTILNQSLQSPPLTLRAEVAPYVYLAALALKGDFSSFKRALTFTSSDFKWFSYLANYLVKTFIPTKVESLNEGAITTKSVAAKSKKVPSQKAFA